MDFAKHTRTLKYLSIIPIIVGVLTFIEGVLPYKSIETKVISKKIVIESKLAAQPTPSILKE